MTERGHEPKLTLVLGGTGKTGRRVVARLAARGVPVRTGSRSGHPPFDWTNPTTWPPAVRGVDSAYLSFYPDLAAPGAADTIGDFTRLAVTHGVRRLVLLSGRGEPEAARAEQVVRESGADWTIVRASWFNQNFSEGQLLDAVRAGEVALPVDAVGEPFVDADDIADVAVAALTGDGHAGRDYEVTGPRLLTFAEAVGEIAAATGRPIRFRSVPVDRYVATLTAQGVPPEVVSLLTYLFTKVLDGRNAHPGDGVRRALGRDPVDFREFASRAAASGVWAG